MEDTMKINKGLTIIAALAMIFTLGSQAMAGRGGGWKNCDGNMGFHGRHGGKHGGYGMMGLGFLRDANLTEDQMQQVVGIVKNYATDLNAKRDAVRTARQDMMKTLMADDADEAAVRKAHAKAATAGEAMMVLRFKMVSDIKKILTAEQLAAVKENMNRRHQRMQDNSGRRWTEFEKQLDALIK